MWNIHTFCCCHWYLCNCKSVNQGIIVKNLFIKKIAFLFKEKPSWYSPSFYSKSICRNSGSYLGIEYLYAPAIIFALDDSAVTVFSRELYWNRSIQGWKCFYLDAFSLSWLKKYVFVLIQQIISYWYI